MDERDSQGRFLPGCRPGPGNPFSRQANTLRAELYKAVTVDDFKAIAAKLVELARAGEKWAIKELLDRLIGRPAIGAWALALDAELADRNIDLASLTDEELKLMANLAAKANANP